MRRGGLEAALLMAMVMVAPGVTALAADQTAAPAAAAATKPPPEEMDRDGKHIVGYDLMTESERAGYRSTLFFMKTLPERDAFRAQHLDSMKKRAKERGVTLKE
jgi:hypothetical protein